MNPEGLLMLAAGVFTIVAAAADWNWFMEHHKARFFVNIMGRNGTRVFYIILGIVITIGALRVCEFWV
ncbi:MAG: immunity 17 family protein [Burkholderiales bacterium]|nr:immunity 17 family protein [Burkholderiales bacterium]